MNLRRQNIGTNNQRVFRRPTGATGITWGIRGERWHGEEAAYKTVMNVAGRLLNIDPDNARKLSGDNFGTNIQPAHQYPEGVVDGYKMEAIPRHPYFVLCPYGTSADHSARRCIEMGERCGIKVEVVVNQLKYRRQMAFREMLAEKIGMLPGQERWDREASQWTDPQNNKGDVVGITIPDKDPMPLRLYIKVGEATIRDKDIDDCTRRSIRGLAEYYSTLINKRLDDSMLEKNSSKSKGCSTGIVRSLTDDEHEWPGAAHWVKENFELLREIIRTAR